MATHYKGKRIDELLEEINRLQQVIEKETEKSPIMGTTHEVTNGYATLVIAKAKLTALKGESNGN